MMKRCQVVALLTFFCVALLSPAAFAGPTGPEGDGDGVFDVLDNCSLVANAPPFDCDTDHDGYGNPTSGISSNCAIEGPPTVA